MFGLKTFWTAIGSFGSWIKAWRAPLRRKALLACAFLKRGEFHVGFGIAAPSDDETTEFSVQGMTRNGRTPFRQSLAVTLYRDCLSGRAPPTPQAEDAFTSLLSQLIDSGAS